MQSIRRHVIVDQSVTYIRWRRSQEYKNHIPPSKEVMPPSTFHSWWWRSDDLLQCPPASYLFKAEQPYLSREGGSKGMRITKKRYILGTVCIKFLIALILLRVFLKWYYLFSFLFSVGIRLFNLIIKNSIII